MIFVAVILGLLQLSTRGESDDAAVLLRLKNSVDDPSGTLSNWNEGIDVCQWNGVSCNAQGNVSGLELQNLTISSSLMGAIYGLPLLIQLSVSESTFKGAISTNSTMAACSLEVISLSRNQNVTFEKFDALMDNCKALKVLDLSRNAANGQFPLLVVGDTLEAVDLSYNMFIGHLPPTLFSNCTSLRSFDISHNNLSGALLVENCTSLEKMSLSYNNFQGSSFPSIQSLPSLEFVDASFNNFSGPIPEVHHNLKHLNLSSNNFTSSSKQLCASTSSRLESLILVNNRLTGRVLHGLMNCSKLKMLDLSFNSLTGDIPRDICGNLPSLEYFSAWVNNLHGKLPSNLSSCTNLSRIILSFNDLSGNIPTSILSNLKKLQWLTLSNNRLTGILPETLEIAQMVMFQVRNNRLEGILPVRIGNMIDLWGNNFSGNIPPTWSGYNRSRLIKVNVAGTSLKLASGIRTCGCIDNIFLFQGLATEDMEHLLERKSGGCKCSLGLLPASFYDYNSSSPQFIDVSFNRLVGGIPKELGAMQDMAYLSLGHNLLSGTIPVELGQLQNVIGLDFSNNKLQGSIPGSFLQLSSLALLNVSYNNLIGPIPQGGQLQTIDASSFAGNAGLCGSPLPSCQVSTPPPISATANDDGENDGQREVVLISFGFGLLAFVLSSSSVAFLDTKKHFVERGFLYYSR